MVIRHRTALTLLQCPLVVTTDSCCSLPLWLKPASWNVPLNPLSSLLCVSCLTPVWIYTRCTWPPLSAVSKLSAAFVLSPYVNREHHTLWLAVKTSAHRHRRTLYCVTFTCIQRLMQVFRLQLPVFYWQSEKLSTSLQRALIASVWCGHSSLINFISYCFLCLFLCFLACVWMIPCLCAARGSLVWTLSWIRCLMSWLSNKTVVSKWNHHPH